MIKLQYYSTKLYDKLANDPEYPINYHQTGSIRLAQNQSRMEAVSYTHLTLPTIYPV